MSATARTTGWAAIAFAIVYIGTFVSNIVLAMLGPAFGRPLQDTGPDDRRSTRAAMSEPSASPSWAPP